MSSLIRKLWFLRGEEHRLCQSNRRNLRRMTVEASLHHNHSKTHVSAVALHSFSSRHKFEKSYGEGQWMQRS